MIQAPSPINNWGSISSCRLVALMLRDVRVGVYNRVNFHIGTSTMLVSEPYMMDVLAMSLELPLGLFSNELGEKLITATFHV